MPLTRKVSFPVVLQKGNRFQIPRLIRWQFKLEPEQVLKVTVETEESGVQFFSRMTADGRITVPKLDMKILHEELKGALKGLILAVNLEPLEPEPSGENNEDDE